MDNSAWSLIFLVPSSSVATNTVGLVGTTIKFMLGFASVIIAVSLVVVIVLMRIQQKAALAAERENSKQLERLNSKLIEASKAKSEFLSNMSHDIRTPMNAIVGMTKLIEHDKDDPDKLDMYVEKIQTSSHHLLSLINDVLDMSKIESGEVTLNRNSVSLADEVVQVENIMRP
jgi:two-component system sensor histidine kinase/response regulator